jgi:hypothetical protein
MCKIPVKDRSSEKYHPKLHFSLEITNLFVSYIVLFIFRQIENILKDKMSHLPSIKHFLYSWQPNKQKHTTTHKPYPLIYYGLGHKPTKGVTTATSAPPRIFPTILVASVLPTNN